MKYTNDFIGWILSEYKTPILRKEQIMNPLTKDFITWLLNNYDVHFIVEESDEDKFNQHFPNLIKGEDYETTNNRAERFTNESR